MLAFKPADLTEDDHAMILSAGLHFYTSRQSAGLTFHIYASADGEPIICRAVGGEFPWALAWTPEGSLAQHVTWTDDLLTVLWLYEAVKGW